jgi:hypothetical protein
MFSQVCKQDVPQVVQRFSELDRVHQSMTAHIGFVMSVQIVSTEVEHGDLLAACLEPDGGEIPAHAQVKCASEDVRGLKTGFSQ